jgi:hypothetical protein
MLHPLRPSQSRSSRVVLLTALAVSTCLAAVAAHEAIDLVGDVALAHDAYDDVAHDARAVLAVLAFVVAACGAIASVVASVQRHDGGAALLATLRGAVPRRILPYAVASLFGTVALVSGMEAVDTIAAGRAVDDLGDVADLLGGSPALGLGIAALSACVASLASVTLLRWLAGASLALRRTIAALSVRPHGGTRAATLAADGDAPLRTRPLRTSRRTGTRGPPHVRTTA